MAIRAGAILGLMMALPVLACGESTPTAPGPECDPIVGPTSPTLRVGDLFRFRFTVPAAADADVLLTFMAQGATGLTRSALTVRLYDGANLLGTVDEYQDTVAFWKGPASAFASGPAVIVDFRTIVNGTIDGRVEFSITRGSLSVDRLDLATIDVLNRDLAVVGAPVITARELCR